MKGKLSIVPTPIGNLEDITFRALRVLREADAVLCEDTRHSAPLLNHYAIQKTLISYHEHNEQSRSEEILKRLKEGENFALISDAGFPGVSDPRYLPTSFCRFSCAIGPARQLVCATKS